MYGPVRTVVWEGEGCEAFPYPDSRLHAAGLLALSFSLVVGCYIGGVKPKDTHHFISCPRRDQTKLKGPMVRIRVRTRPRPYRRQLGR